MAALKKGDWVRCKCGAVGRVLHPFGKSRKGHRYYRVQWYAGGEHDYCRVSVMHCANRTSNPPEDMLTVIHPTPQEVLGWLL